MAEVWKPIKETNGQYEVSNTGKVRAMNYGNTGVTKELQLSPDKITGYVRARVKDTNGNVRLRLVHRLVADAFIANHDGLPCINHKDEDKTNNHATNLEWCTYKYNANYGTATIRATQTRLQKKIKNL